MVKQVSRKNETQYWVCEGVPEDVIDTQGLSILYVGDIIVDSLTDNSYRVLTSDPDPVNFGFYNNVTYILSVTDKNIDDIPRRSRNRIELSSPAFDTIYQPNTNFDVEVCVNINFTSAASLNSQVTIQASQNGSNWMNILKIRRQIALAVNLIDCATFTVPSGNFYRIGQTGSGASIDSIFYLRK